MVRTVATMPMIFPITNIPAARPTAGPVSSPLLSTLKQVGDDLIIVEVTVRHFLKKSLLHHGLAQVGDNRAVVALNWAQVGDDLAIEVTTVALMRLGQVLFDHILIDGMMVSSPSVILTCPEFTLSINMDTIWSLDTELGCME